MGPGPYILVQDDDCHWYVIPAAREKLWWVWFESNEQAPEWADRVGGSPTLVSFSSYSIK